MTGKTSQSFKTSQGFKTSRGFKAPPRPTRRRSRDPRIRDLTLALYGLTARLLSQIAREWRRCPRAACRRRRRCCGTRCAPGQVLHQPAIREALRPSAVRS